MKKRIIAALMLFTLIFTTFTTLATQSGELVENESNTENNTQDTENSDTNSTPEEQTTAQNLSFTIDKNTILSNTLEGTTTKENVTLTYIIVEQPTHGTLTHTDQTSKNFTYTPDLNYTGTDTFTYKVNDGTEDSNIATVTITIQEEQENIIPFTYIDMKDHWANYSASHLAARNLIIGEEIGNRYYFNPEKQMTRSEFMLFLLAITESNEDANLEIPKITFADSDKIPEWLEEAAKLAYAKGIIKGSAEGNKIYLNANKIISRQEAVTMVNNVLKPTNSEENLEYTDKDSIATWAIQAVKNLSAYEIIQGNKDKTFKPASRITRGQAAEMTYKLLKQLEKDSLTQDNNTEIK